MLVTLTKKVAGDYTGPALKITVHAYLIESIDNFDTGDDGCTLTIRPAKDEQVTYDCVESHAEATKLWEKAITPPKFEVPHPVPPKKKPTKKKVVKKAALVVVPKKKVVKKGVMKKVANKAAKKVVKKLLAKKSK
jgi:hypothetical protein